jgi:hypothetical protein
MYFQIEKNYSVITLTSYAYGEFLKDNDRSLDLDDLTASNIPRFVQDQVINYNIKPTTLNVVYPA